MPRELGHFHAVSRQNCTEVTVLAHTSLILSAGTTHTSCSGRGQKPHYVTLYAQGMKSLFLYCKEGLFTSPENGTCLSHPWCVQLQTLPWVIKSHIFSYSAHLSKKKKKRHQISANRHSHVCMVAAIRWIYQTGSILFCHPCCCRNPDTNWETLRSATHTSGKVLQEDMRCRWQASLTFSVTYSPVRMNGKSRGKTQ